MSTLRQELAMTITDLATPGKGLLASDESLGTIKKRFDTINITSTENTRRDYRELLFATPNLGDFISGVILFDETFKQKNKAGVLLPELLKIQDIVPGIKVDLGTIPLSNFPGETITQGLDDLTLRLAKYKQMGARFAKWRAAFHIGTDMPSSQAIANNTYTLARYAAICQELGIVPIVEPEVLMDGDHTLAISARVTEDVLHALFHALHKQRVALEYIILKPNMVESGHQCPILASPQQVAQATLLCLQRTVPPAVPLIYFLSGGQSEITATANLNALNISPEEKPWILSFSYGRALQTSALQAWRGDPSNRILAQHALLKRARLNSAAAQGKYTNSMENG